MIKRKEVIGTQTLILGDCLEVMPTLAEGWAILTDPPYGIGHRRGKSKDRGKGRAIGADCSAWDGAPFDPTPFIGVPCLMWGANHFANKLPPGRWLIWDKTLGAGSGDFSEFEVAWLSTPGADRFFRHMWMGVQRESEHGQSRVHPTQKPLALMEWCLGFLPDAKTILDPFMGSGTTLVACQRMGRAGTGIELDPHYFDVACRRVEEACRQPDFFVQPPAPAPEQAKLWSEE